MLTTMIRSDPHDESPAERVAVLGVPRLLLKPRDAAKALGVSERTLHTYTANGDIPAVRIGRSVRYSPNALRRWIRQTESE